MTEEPKFAKGGVVERGEDFIPPADYLDNGYVIPAELLRKYRPLPCPECRGWGTNSSGSLPCSLCKGEQ